jgi:peptide/nickel transport system ATP-binding protein
LKNNSVIQITDLIVKLRSNDRIINAVDSVSLDVMEGEIISIVGESGSGKTTLCKAMVGLLKPSSGRIEVLGKQVQYDSSSLHQLWKQVQMVFQDPYSTFDPLWLILDSIAVPLKKFRHELSESEVRTIESDALSQVGLSYSDLEGKYPHELSGGQRQRASIARAIIINPKILIADEPVSMLDASLKMGVLRLIKDLNREHGLTIISVTHDLTVAEYLSKRIGVMQNAKIVELASTREIVRSPKHAYTRLLLKAVPRISNKDWLDSANDAASARHY